MTIRRLGIVAGLAVALPVFVTGAESSLPAQSQPEGRGSYALSPPAGGATPSDASGRAVAPRVGPSVTGAAPTNDWWSSLIFPRANAFSEVMHAHPFAAEAHADGLALGHANTAVATAGGYDLPWTEDLRVRVAGLRSGAAVADAWSDWTVTAAWRDGPRTLRATLGHGLPYVQCEVAGGRAQIAFASAPIVRSNVGGVLFVDIRGRSYGLFAPGGAVWNRTGNLFDSDLAGLGFFSVAVLPDRQPATFQLFQDHAFAWITDTRVAWSYDETTARLDTLHTVSTQARQGTETRTLLALYPFQARNLLGAVPRTESYASPRGAMPLLIGNTFTTRLPFDGVLPGLPPVPVGTPGFDRRRLEIALEAVADQPWQQIVPGNLDTYWTGKALGRAAALVEIAQQLGRADLRDRLLLALRNRLEDWLTADPGETDALFHLEPTWGTVIGYPASFGADRELNDHHFHYGYFLQAAATVARFDPVWAEAQEFGGMVELLVKDVANADRGDLRFPFLRCFDPYAGHSWASGHAAFRRGNNEESSSEAQNFASALVLWGAETGDRGWRDLGIYLHATAAASIRDAWFDTTGSGFPATYPQDHASIVWGDGAAYSTWWTNNPEEIHGITFLPLTGGSLYLGRDPAYVLRNHANLVRSNGGPANEWLDIISGYLAFADPAAALAQWNARPGYVSEAGESRAHTEHWLYSLSAHGQLEPGVTASVPTAAVFRKAAGSGGGSVLTHVAYNPEPRWRAVRFSDGVVLRVPPKAMATDRGHVAPPPPPAPATGPVGHVVSTEVVYCPRTACLTAATPVPLGQVLYLRLRSARPAAPMALLLAPALGPTPLADFDYSALWWGVPPLAVQGTTNNAGDWLFTAPVLSQRFPGSIHLEAYLLDAGAPNGIAHRSNPLTMTVR